MKKLLLSALLVASAMGVSAQRWDFTNWSAATVANLKAVNPSNTEWSDIEKSDATAPTDISKENCFWEVKAQGNADGGTLMANGEVIKETEGLLFIHTHDRSLAIAVNYPETSLGAYHGPSYLWLGSKEKNYIVIPNVAPGTEITIGLESHKPAEGRGVDLFIGRGNSGTKLLNIDGVANAYPTTYEEQTWVVPTDATDTPNEDGTYDITIRNSNGCHLYFIQAGDDNGNEPESLKIAYLYQSTYSSYVSLEDDVLYQCTKLAEENALAVDVANFTAEDTDTLDALAANYDLVVVSEAIDGKSAFGAKIAEYVNRVPMLSFKSFFYNSGRWNWGTGKNPSTAKTEGGVPFLTIVAGAEEHPIFADVEIGDDNTVQMFEEYEGLLSNMVQGYEASAGSLIENDNVLATVTGSAGTFNAIHEHGTKNTYMLIPLSSDAILVEGTENLGWETAIPMINNAINYLAATKSKVTPCVKPAAEYAYDDMVTTVTLTSATPESQIYYTLDGSVPTEASTLYAAPFQVTAPCKLSAIAFRQGYDPSSVLEDSVAVMPKSAAPVISVADAEGGKLVTITAAEGAVIYYNLISATPTTASKVYTEPFVVSRSCTVSAIAAAEGKLESSAVAEYIEIAAYPLRQKEIVWANFQDAPDVWVWANTDSTTTNNGDIFKAYDYVAVTDTTPEGPTYSEVDFNNGWKVGTYGQRINLQKTGTSVEVGADYGPLSPDDAGASGYAMSFLVTKKANDPCTAFLQTTKTYEGPFDINIWACGQTGSTSYIEALEVSVSADGMEWAVIDTFKYESTKKMRRFIAHYDDKAAVYVKIAHVGDPAKSNKYKAMIFDVKLMAEGVAEGIENVATASGELVSESYYNLSGMMIKEPAKGVVIVKKVYADGTMKIEKQLIK